MWLSHSSAGTTTTNNNKSLLIACGILGSALNTLHVWNDSILSTPLGREYYY